MKNYNFDKILNRRGTNSVKYDLLKERFGKEDIMSMWVADMDFACPDFITQAISKRLQHPIFGYSIRPESFFKSVVNWMKERHQWDVKTSEISFSPGVVPGLFLALKAFSKPGDKIIVQQPVYFPFFTTVSENDRQLVSNNLIEKDDYYTMDFENLEKQIDEKCKMIFVSNPHNPVGRAWKKDELHKLVDICKRHNVLIISDEIHSDLILKPNKHIPLASISDDAASITLTLMAARKTFNIAGLSTSIVISNNPILLKKYNEAMDATHLMQGNIFGTVATEAAYTHGAKFVDNLMSYISENIDYVEEFIFKNLPKIEFKRPEATYLLWLNMKAYNLSDKKLMDFFVNEAGIAVNSGKTFGSSGSRYVRLNAALPKSELIMSMNKLKAAIDKI